MSFEISIERGRTKRHTISLYESDGETSIVLAAEDDVMVKLYRRNGATPVLDIASGETALSSSIEIDELGDDPVASVTVTWDESDTEDLDPGVYTCEVIVVDASASYEMLPVETGIVYLLPSGGGLTGSDLQ